MEKTKKSFGQIWSELTSEQAEYLKDYINKQRQEAVKEYKTQQLRLHGVVDSEAKLPLMNSCDMASDPRDCNRENQCYYCQK